MPLLNSLTGTKGLTRFKIITSSTVWTVPMGISAVKAHIFGSGGGGGGGTSYSNQGNTVFGGRGGTGAYLMGIIPVTGGQNLTITIGTGGVGGAGGINHVSGGSAGGNGSDTSIGGIIVGGGTAGTGGVWGPGGGGTNPATALAGSAGTIVSTGTLAVDEYISSNGFNGLNGQSNTAFPPRSSEMNYLRWDDNNQQYYTTSLGTNQIKPYYTDNHLAMRQFENTSLAFSLNYCLGGDGGAGSGGNGYAGKNGLIILEY